jgi:hypothetical protein
MSFSEMKQEDYRKQGLIIEALTQDELRKDKERHKKNTRLLGLAGIFFLLSVVVAFAHPSDGLVTTPEFMNKPYAVTSTSISEKGNLYSVLGYVQRDDIPELEGETWLNELLSSEQGAVYEKCVQTSETVYLCQSIKTRSTGQDIGFLGTKSGVSKEN